MGVHPVADPGGADTAEAGGGVVSEDVSGVKCLFPALTRSPLALVALASGRHHKRLRSVDQVDCVAVVFQGSMRVISVAVASTFSK